MNNTINSLFCTIKRHWGSTWFSGQSAFDLGVARAVGCLLILLFALPPWDLTISLDEVNGSPSTERPALFILRMLVGDFSSSSQLWASVHWICIISGIVAMLGYRTMTSLRIFAITYLLLVSHMWSFGELHHPRIAPVWFLLVLFFTPCGHRFSIDAIIRKNKVHRSSEQLLSPKEYAWPGNLFLALIAYSYSYSAIWKLGYQGGIEWMNGLTTRFYLFIGDVEFMTSTERNSLYYWIYDSLPALRFAGIMTIAFELFFPLSLFVRSLRLPFLFIAFAFHLGNYALRGENGIFLLYPALTALLLLRFETKPIALTR